MRCLRCTGFISMMLYLSVYLSSARRLEEVLMNLEEELQRINRVNSEVGVNKDGFANPPGIPSQTTQKTTAFKKFTDLKTGEQTTTTTTTTTTAPTVSLPDTTNNTIIPVRQFAPIKGFLEYQAASSATLGIEATLGLYYGEFPDMTVQPVDSWVDARAKYTEEIQMEGSRLSSLYRLIDEPMKSNIGNLALHMMTSTLVNRRMTCRDAIFARILYQSVLRKARKSLSGVELYKDLEPYFTNIYSTRGIHLLMNYIKYFNTGVATVLQEYFFSPWVLDYNEILWSSIYNIQYSLEEPSNTNTTDAALEAVVQAHKDKMDCLTYEQWEKEWLSKCVTYYDSYQSNLYHMLHYWLLRQSGLTSQQWNLQKIILRTIANMHEVTDYMARLGFKIIGKSEDLVNFMRETLNNKEIEFLKILLREKTPNRFPETINQAISAQQSEIKALKLLQKKLQKLGLQKLSVYTTLQRIIKDKEGRLALYQMTPFSN